VTARALCGARSTLSGRDGNAVLRTRAVDLVSPQTDGLAPAAPPLRRLGAALRAALRASYDGAAVRQDTMAGVVVGIVALPLSMALAIASGVPPQHGLYTAIVGGAVIALLGGSRVQVSGPTAAFVAILVPISARFGIGGLLLATVMAGVILIVLGATGMGKLVEFDRTEKLFTAPAEQLTEDYVTGRFG